MDQTLTFTDLDDGAESVVIVRPVPGGVGRGLSKREDGDIELLMPPEVAEQLVTALRAAATWLD